MKNHLVSVLLPCYNVEPFLPQCLQSLTSQTYGNLQIVLIDDGSKDNTWQVLQAWQGKDSRIEIYHQENQGVAVTRNRLLEKAKGDYVLFVDSDDWVEPDMVEFLVRQMEEGQADVATCGMVVNDTPVRQSEVVKECWDQEKTVYEFLRHVSFGGSLWNKLFRNSLVHNVRFHCGISYGEDALFVWEVLQHVRKVVVTDRQLYHYRMNGQSLSHQSWTPEKKGSGHLVWASICQDVERNWESFYVIVRARFALEDMWGLYFAALSGYKYDSHIKERQRNVRASLSCIKKSQLVSYDKYLLACLLSYWYGFGAVLRLLKG